MALKRDAIWKPIPGWDGYEASDLGEIRSLKSGSPKLLKASLGQSSYYLRVYLSMYNEREPFLVHVLVLSAFQGVRPEGRVGAHLDGNPMNNRLENLMWATVSQNVRHQKAHKLGQKFSKS